MASEAVVWLPDTKFASAKFESSAFPPGDENPDHGKIGKVEIPRSKQQKYSSFVGTPSRTATDRLAEDRIGKELAPDATVWELYEEETEDFDNELVNGRNQNLDMLLLFAGLFSAVVTGFLVESTSLLQQDPADASLALLLYIAQSQQRLESGNPQPTSTPIEISPFTSSQYARWINGLWFLSLALSLCTALVAMLAKEWLTAFTSARPRSPYVHALIHQQRLKALDRWYPLHIIDFLPTLLHFALLLFSVGLVVYLWMLDYAIAVAIAVVVAATALFYGVTAVLPSIYLFCPFVTQVSKYIRGAFAANRTPAKWIERVLSKLHTASIEVLEALRWLSENAQDPTTGECSYQALAGMCMSPARAGDSSSSTASVDYGSSNKPMISMQESKLLIEMIQTICRWIPPALASENGTLSSSQGMAISRYAVALPKLLISLRATSMQQAQSCDARGINGAQMDPLAKLAFATLERIWGDEQPHLPGDAYALLTAAELHLIEVVASSYSLDQPDSTVRRGPVADHDGISGDNGGGPAQVELNMGRTQDDTNPGIIPLFELRARCSRALFRAAMAIRYREAGSITIRSDVLVYLVKSVQLIFQCPSLNPKAPMTTHQPQLAGDNTLPKFLSHIAGSGMNRYLYPFDIGDEDGLLTGLIKCLCLDNSTELSELVQTTRVTLFTVAPILLGQWLNMNLEQEPENDTLMEALQYLRTCWPGQPHFAGFRVQRQEIWSMDQLTVVAVVATLCSKYQGIRPLAINALQKLCQLTNMGTNGRASAASMAASSYHLIIKLIRNLCTYEEPDLQALRFMVQWLLTPLEYLSGVNLVQFARRNSVWDPDDDIYRVFLGVWVRTPGLERELEQFLDGIFNGSMDEAIGILWSTDGLSTLAAIGQHQLYAPLIAERIAKMTASFLEQDYGAIYWEISDHKPILPHFLQVAGLSLDHIHPSSLSYPMLSKSFVYAASVLRSDLQGNITTAGLGPCSSTFFQMICGTLRKLHEALPEGNGLLSEYEDILQLAEDPEAWMYGTLHWLFENTDLGQREQQG